MLDITCAINFAPLDQGGHGPLTMQSKLRTKVVGTGGSLAYHPAGYYEIGGTPSTPPGVNVVRALVENSKQWQPLVAGAPFQGWCGGVFDMPAFPTTGSLWPFSAWCVGDAIGQASTVGTYHPGLVGVRKVEPHVVFTVFRDNEFQTGGYVSGTVPLVLGQSYIWVQTHRLVSSGVVVEGWIYDLNGVEIDHVSIEGNLIGHEKQNAIKLGCFNGLDMAGGIIRFREWWWGQGNGPHPGPMRL